MRNGTLEKAYEEALYKKYWKNDIRAMLGEATQKVKYWYKVDKKAIWSFVLALAMWPLTITGVFWLPAMIVSIVFGADVLKQGTSKRKLVIAGLIVDGTMVLFWIIMILVFIVAMVKG